MLDAGRWILGWVLGTGYWVFVIKTGFWDY